jgi:hypothetical protein
MNNGQEYVVHVTEYVAKIKSTVGNANPDLEKMTSIDILTNEEIIRCKDCKYHSDSRPYKTECFCEKTDMFFPADHFCSDGKRRKQ